MNVIGLATIAVLLCSALASPLLLTWGIYCISRRNRRTEGVVVLGSGILLASCLLVVGYLTAPKGSPGIFRLQAVVIAAGVFAVGAAAGKVLHFVMSWWQNTRRMCLRTMESKDEGSA